MLFLLPLLFLMYGTYFIYIFRNTKYINPYYRFFKIDEQKDEQIDEQIDEQKDEQQTEQKTEQKVIKYEDKYWDKFERMMDKEEKEGEKSEISKNNILFENTPNGNVLMFYDSNRTSFIYYADTAIPYRYLETVARKYVTTYFCLHIYVDMKKEIEEAAKKIHDKKEELERIELEKIELEKQERENKEQKDDRKDRTEERKNVFAKLKNYNTGSNTVVKGTKLAETNPNRSAVSTVTSTKEYILKENANRFSYEGKIVNYSLLNKPKRQKVEFSFADFKKMQKNK